MTIGRITSTNTKDENKVFNGMDITAEYLNSNGKVSTVSFHYATWTKNVRGKVESVLQRLADGKEIPSNITNVVTN